MEDDDEYDNIREKEFHNTVREYIIFLLLFMVLYLLSWLIIERFRRKDKEDYFSIDEDEVTVYKISLYLCTFSLSVCICSSLLLPISIISNEVLLHYPKSYYVKWLNHSLIQGIWNLVFLFSNLSLFALLPFAYLFTESEGLSGYRRGVKSRVYETCMVLCLIGVIVFGLSYVVSALIDSSRVNFDSLHNFGSYCLPFLYSCVSFLGCLMLLLCTPLGFTRLFGVVSGCLVKPQFLQDVNEEFNLVLMEENLLKRRLNHAIQSGKTYITPIPMLPVGSESPEGTNDLLSLRNGALQSGLREKLAQVHKRRQILQKQKATSSFQRNIVYPLAILALLVITALTVLLVLVNVLQLLIGIKALPKSTYQFTLGLTSLSKFGALGAAIELLVIGYLAVTSCVGLYTMPFMTRIRPKTQKTPLACLIANSAILLILSSALPLLATTLGITNFDLLGEFGEIEWLGSFNIVLLYNILFAGVTTLSLVNKLTAPVCKELLARMKSMLSVFTENRRALQNRFYFSTSTVPPLKED